MHVLTGTAAIRDFPWKGRNEPMIRHDALPEQDWQKTAVFPDWKGYLDDTLAMNCMLSFQGFHGQGSIWLSVSEQVRSLTLYVNGTRMDTSGIGPGVWSLDLSALAVDGVNTLQLSNLEPAGLRDAVHVYIPFPTVLDGDGQTEGIRPEALQLISDIIDSDIAWGFPSAQLAVVRNGRMAVSRAWGRVCTYAPNGRPLDSALPVTPGTLYDLASVTKMFAGNYAIQKLVTDGLLSLDAAISDLLGPGFYEKTLDIAYADAKVHPDLTTQKAWKRALTVRDILRHQAGFPASPQYNHPDYDLARLALGGPGSNPCPAMDRAATLDAICRTPLLYEPGTQTVYSDVDYMLLTFVIEAVTGKRLDEYMREVFFEPLGLERITFLPLENGFTPSDCAATELNGNTRDGQVSFPGVRTYTLRGEVHDERAWHCMQGVSGHAGLFSCAEDLARLAFVMLSGGYGGHRFFSRSALDLFTAPKSLENAQWGLGWWREGDDQRVWYFGTQSAPCTIGHQGWTGTLAMVDPSRSLIMVYLTNKISSPITRQAGPNAFDGSCYTASTLGFVPQILSMGMDTDKDISMQLLDLTADMAQSALRLCRERPDRLQPCIRNAMSKADVLEKWAAGLGHRPYLELAASLRKTLQEMSAAGKVI